MMKKKKRKKRTPVAIAKDNLWETFSIYTRTRDCIRTTGTIEYGLCISCSKPYPFKKLQAGHFIPGRRNSNLFYERGCHAQCYNCNINLKGNLLNYMDALIKLYYPEIIEELRENDRQRLKFIEVDLREHNIYYKDEIRKLKETSCEQVAEQLQTGS